MISIQQDSCGKSNINIGGLVNNNFLTNIKINVSLINADIDKLIKLKSSSTVEKDRNNIDSIIGYLNKLKSKISKNGDYELSWMLGNWELICYPLPLMHYNPYNIRATDYIETSDATRMVRINCRDVYEIIAFDMMYRDLDDTFESMEKKLESIGIVSICDKDNILKYLTESAVDASKYLKIGDCPYASCDGKLSWDYFSVMAKGNNKAYNSGKYIDCVGKSIRIAETLITGNIINKLTSTNTKYSIAAINEDGIYLLIENYSGWAISNAVESIIVRAFGRKFEVIPEINIF